MNSVHLQRIDWCGTRAAGIARLQAFVEGAGRRYAADRNIDFGPEDRSNVSAMSPWIRRRLVCEPEVIDAVLRRHSRTDAEKFIQEVCWRTYWKGWLEMRPQVLARFEAQHAALTAACSTDAAMVDSYRRAVEARTGLACFDAWVRELRQHGWLHNHARMWFASIWIFTLRLPWQLGAGFFFDHLLDADPASNTLSWRWVAGLHTRGKHYLARAENIRTYSNGRFDPRGELDETAAPLREDGADDHPQPLPPCEPAREAVVGVLLADEDLHPESWRIGARVAGIAALEAAPGSAQPGPAARFKAAALADGLKRASDRFQAPIAPACAPETLADWAAAIGVREVVTGYAPVGATARAVEGAARALQARGIRLVRLRREWDELAWPHARSGFFKFKESIPSLLAQLPGA